MLDADGIITIYDIQTGAIVAQYEGMDVVRAISDKGAEIARLRKAGEAMAARLRELRQLAIDIDDELFTVDDAAALEDWERATK